MGFSVKSQFGSPATLFNASPSAPLLYWVAHCDDALMKEFNALHDARGNRGWFACCQPFFDARGLRVSFARARNVGSFERNLLFIREGMLEIVAACVRERFIRRRDDRPMWPTIDGIGCRAESDALSACRSPRRCTRRP